MFGKQIKKYIEDGEIVEGEVVNEGHEGGIFEKVWSFFFSHGATVGGNTWEKRYRRSGQEFNPASGRMEYTSETGSDRRPTYLEQTIIPGYGDDRANDGY